MVSSEMGCRHTRNEVVCTLISLGFPCTPNGAEFVTARRAVKAVWSIKEERRTFNEVSHLLKASSDFSAAVPQLCM